MPKIAIVHIYNTYTGRAVHIEEDMYKYNQKRVYII